ncbi:hypothetical protein K469DRAFT_707587, partial [Zopfia rhizophila CBS 207.26]
MVANFIHDLAGYWVHKDFRTKADNNFLYSRYFDFIKKKIAKYDIQPHNMYNMDEKGFLIGVLNKLKRIYCRSDYKLEKLRGAGQDENRDWITVLASICADGSYLPPALIYKGQSGN